MAKRKKNSPGPVITPESPIQVTAEQLSKILDRISEKFGSVMNYTIGAAIFVCVTFAGVVIWVTTTFPDKDDLKELRTQTEKQLAGMNSMFCQIIKNHHKKEICPLVVSYNKHDREITIQKMLASLDQLKDTGFRKVSEESISSSRAMADILTHRLQPSSPITIEVLGDPLVTKAVRVKNAKQARTEMQKSLHALGWEKNTPVFLRIE